MKQILIFLGSLALSFVLINFAITLWQSNYAINSTYFFLIGLGSFLAALLAVSTRFPGAMLVAAVLAIIGLYFLGRASGSIETAWLAKTFAVLLVAGSGTLLFLALPYDKHPSQHQETPDYPETGIGNQ